MNRDWTRVALLGLLAACDEPATEPAAEPSAPQPLEAAEAPPAPAAPPSAGENCRYAYDPAHTKLTWTAFKLTDRVGVSGSFDKIAVTGTEPASAPAPVFQNMAFEIETGSVNSGNPERDPKLVSAFFGTLQDGATIRGRVTELSDSAATVQLTLGGVTKPVKLFYTVDGATLTATGSIDTKDYGGQPAIDALNAVCKEQHTGPDKVSKLWSDVELKVESQLSKTCD